MSFHVRWRPIAALAVLPTLVLTVETKAQDFPPQVSPLTITITPNRRPTPIDEVASSVTVITRQDIERRQQSTLPDALRDVPGLNVVQTGGSGGTAQVYLRGANAAQTKVLIDGVVVNDPSDSNGAFDFGNALTADVERIEVLRGPQSGLYGADAIGGVINIVTRKGRGPTEARVGLDGGSFGTFNQTASVDGSTERFDYVATVAHFHSGDTPVTPPSLLPPGQRAQGQWYDNLTASTRLGAKVTDNFDLGIVARYTDARLHYTGDDFSVYPSVPSAVRSRSTAQQLVTRAEGHLLLWEGRLDQRLGVGFTDYRRQYDDPANGLAPASRAVYRGDRTKIDWQASVTLAKGQVLVTGAEYTRERLVNSPISASQDAAAGFASLQSAIDGWFFNTLSVRGDDFSSFGGAVTWRVAPAILLAETGTRIKATYGTGFKAPSLTQLYVDYPSFGFFANPSLQPERARGYDVGFEQRLFGGDLEFGATWFHNDIRDMIVTNATYTSLVNSSHVTTQGVEAYATVVVTDELRLRGDYIFTLTHDDDTGAQLLRRPKNKASLTAIWQPTEATSVSASLVHVGSDVDVARDLSALRVRGGNYTTVNLSASYRLDDTWTAFGRVDNLLNRQYQTPVGFEAPGFGVFVGVKMKMEPGSSMSPSSR